MRFFHKHQRLDRHAMRPARGRGHWSEDDSAMDGGRGHHRGGGRRRMFDNGELRLILLHLIAAQPRHGYDLIRAIEELSGGAYAPSPGVIYPTITLLNDMALIGEQETEGARKQFAITPQGQALLAENAKPIAALIERLGAVAKVREQTDAAPVRRAMHNLKSVLLDKLSSGTDKDSVLQAVALIDEAAQKIERL
jgi:DNA-binding PadR family transcriptional regulator